MHDVKPTVWMLGLLLLLAALPFMMPTLWLRDVLPPVALALMVVVLWRNRRSQERQLRQHRLISSLKAANQDLAATLTGYLQENTRLLQTGRVLRSMVDNAHEGIFQSTPEGRYLLANQALATMYGYASPEELLEHRNNIRHEVYVDPQRRDEFIRLIERDGCVQDFQSQAYRRDGSRIWITENARAVMADGCLLYYEGTVEDITAFRSAQAELEWYANFDVLTGLANRSHFGHGLHQALAHARRLDKPLAVAFIDLDRFKAVNDSLGHEVGDRLLRAVAQRIQEELRAEDLVGRLGGDEFALVLVSPADRAAVAVALTRLRDRLLEPYWLDGKEVRTGASIGVSLFPLDGHDAETLLKHADVAMYQSKARKDHHIQFYNDDLCSITSGKLELEVEMRGALERSEWFLVYQPKFDLATRKLSGMEALVRWQHPHRGVIGPNDFIPLAEETGLIHDLGHWVMEAACRQGSAWRAAGLGEVVIAVNVSPRQLQQPDFVARVAALLAATGQHPSCLELEITENVMLDNPGSMATLLAELRGLGLRIAIDDFGTGYSSLSYLQRLPIQTLKLDRSFVNEIASAPDAAAIAQAIISLGRSLRLRVVAEGVETVQQLQCLHQWGCDEAQGYHLARPMLPDHWIELLRAPGRPWAAFTEDGAADGAAEPACPGGGQAALATGTTVA